MPEKEKALLYYRVSTGSHVERGLGLDVQKKLCREFCRKNRLKIVGEFCDEGISGATIDRPGLQDLLAAVNGVDYVVVANTSRLWRDDFTRALIQRELKKAGKDVKAVDNPKYSLYVDSPEDFLINGMMELLDSYERLAITLKLKRARKQKAASGQKASGTAPFGYRWVERKTGDRREKVIEPDPEETEVVRAIFTSYLRHQSLLQIGRRLTEEGIRSRRGKPFSAQALHHILHNDFYIGTVRHGAVQEKGKHPPIISPVVFGKVQKALERNRKRM